MQTPERGRNRREKSQGTRRRIPSLTTSPTCLTSDDDDDVNVYEIIKNE